jgi:hypothetical protein
MDREEEKADSVRAWLKSRVLSVKFLKLALFSVDAGSSIRLESALTQALARLLRHSASGNPNAFRGKLDYCDPINSGTALQ